MARKQTRAVAKKEEAKTPATAMPDFMAGHEHAGTDIDSDIVEIPRVKLLQALSPELENFEDLRQGDWFHNITDQSFGKEFTFIPCFVFKSVILFRPRSDGGGILARSFDGETWDNPNQEFDVTLKGGTEVTWKTGKDVKSSGLCSWGSENPSDPNSPPAATVLINVIGYSPDHAEESPYALSFMRSSFKVGKKLAGNLKMSSAPIYGRVFRMKSVRVDGPEGPYLEPQVLGVGLVQDKETFDRTFEIYKAFEGKKVMFDIDSGEGQGDAPSDAETSDY